MKTPMTFLASIGTAILMNACASVTPNVNTGLKKACLPEAIIMQSALGRESIKSKVLVMRYNTGRQEVGHVVVLFCYGRQLAAWDSTWGSIPIGPAENYKLNASRLGGIYLEKKYGYGHSRLQFASVVDNPLQTGRYAGD